MYEGTASSRWYKSLISYNATKLVTTDARRDSGFGGLLGPFHTPKPCVLVQVARLVDVCEIVSLFSTLVTMICFSTVFVACLVGQCVLLVVKCL